MTPVGDGTAAPPEDPIGDCIAAWEDNRQCFPFRTPTPEHEDDDEPEESGGVPEITITDLARFAPQPGSVHGEPNDLGVAGLPTNLLADSDSHTAQGTLFGVPLSVRFTPESYVFHPGDGTTHSTSTPGSTWNALDQPEFTETETSHVYSEPGAFRATVDTRYSAELDLGAGWFPLAGEITRTSAPQTIRIFEAHTALVAHSCAEDPSGPGC